MGEGVTPTRPGPVAARVPRPVLAALATSIGTVLPPFLIGALSIQIGEDLALTAASLGGLVGVCFGTAAAGTVLLRGLVDRRRWDFWLRTGALLTAACLLGLAAATSLWHLGALLALAGLAMAIVIPASNVAVVREVDAQRHGLMFGVKQTAVPAATMLAGLALPVLALRLGWRATFLVLALLPLLGFVSVPRRPGRDTARAVQAPSGGRRSGRAVLPMACLSLAGALATGAVNAFLAFFVLYNVGIGMSVAVAGTALAAGSAAGLAVRVGAGWFVDRRQRDALRDVAALLLASAAGYVLVSTGIPLAAWIGSGMVFLAGFGWHGLYHLAAVHHRPAAPGAASSVAVRGVFLGALFGPVLFGLLAQHVSFTASWRLSATSAVVAGALMLVSRSLFRREGAAPGRRPEHSRAASGPQRRRTPLPPAEHDE